MQDPQRHEMQGHLLLAGQLSGTARMSEVGPDGVHGRQSGNKQ